MDDESSQRPISIQKRERPSVAISRAAMTNLDHCMHPLSSNCKDERTSKQAFLP